MVIYHPQSLQESCLDCILNNLQFLYLDCFIYDKSIPYHIGNMIYDYTMYRLKKARKKIHNNSLLLFYKEMISLKRIKYERCFDCLIDDISFVQGQEVQEIYLGSNDPNRIRNILERISFKNLKIMSLYSRFSLSSKITSKFNNLKHLVVLKLFEMNFDSSNESIFQYLKEFSLSIEELELSLSSFSTSAYNLLQKFIFNLKKLKFLTFCSTNFISKINEDEIQIENECSCKKIVNIKVYNCQISCNIAKNFKILIILQVQLQTLNLEHTNMDHGIGDNIFSEYDKIPITVQNILLSGCFPLKTSNNVIKYICQQKKLKLLNFNNNCWKNNEKNHDKLKICCLNVKEISFKSNEISPENENIVGKIVSCMKCLDILALDNTNFHKGTEFFKQLYESGLQLTEFSFSAKNVHFHAYEYIVLFIRNQKRLAKFTIEYLNQYLCIEVFSKISSLNFCLEELHLPNGYFNARSLNILNQFKLCQKRLKRVTIKDSLFQEDVKSDFKFFRKKMIILKKF